MFSLDAGENKKVCVKMTHHQLFFVHEIDHPLYFYEQNSRPTCREFRREKKCSKNLNEVPN